jgi:superfamily I DNA and/or RNA helicase
LNLNFGPLNRKSGRRRLNVLLSRAKQKIDFFSSIQSSDLSLSDNDSLNLLRLFLLQIETPKDETLFYFPHKLKVKSISKETEPKEVEFKNLIEKLKDANELLTFYRVLHQRGWKIKF